jgi:exopolysaccharide biosynthesis polyprenyl glycosylphosphotransferase
MNFPKVTRQTNTSSLPLASQLSTAGRRAFQPEPVREEVATGPLQWLLEGTGWDILRPTVDIAAACAATAVAIFGFGSNDNFAVERAPLLALPIFVVLLLYIRGLYRSRLRALVLDSIVPVTGAVSVAAMGVVILGVLLNGEAPDQTTWVHLWILTLIAVGAGRMVLTLGQRFARARRWVGRPVLILGAGVVGSQVAQRLETHPEYGLRPVGFLDDEPRSLGDVVDCDVPVVGTVEDVDEIVARTGVDHLIVAFSSVTDSRVSPLIQRCQELGIEVSVVPRMFDTINNRVSYEAVGGLPLLSFSSVSPRGAQFTLKHAFDRIAAFALLLVLSPLMLAVALAVRISSPGPVLFRQRRVGRDGKVFDLYKFRSMRMAPERPAPAAVSDPPALVAVGEASDPTTASTDGAQGAGEGTHDAHLHWLGGDVAPGGIEGTDRRTAVGRLIRRTAIDELPQLINVVRGEMSLVGPRPERPEFVELFRQEVARYGDRHRVRSGITGWAQVHGLRGKTSLAERVEWDNYYIAHWSLGLDLKILVLTVLALFRGAE